MSNMKSLLLGALVTVVPALAGAATVPARLVSLRFRVSTENKLLTS